METESRNRVVLHKCLGLSFVSMNTFRRVIFNFAWYNIGKYILYSL